MQSIAMGSKEGFDMADKMIIQAAKQGFWVVLKNVHLAIKWLSDLEKKLYTINATGENYRLFLTMEMNPNLPVALIKQSRVYTFEPPAGVKASLMRSFKVSDRIEKNPVERARMHFLLSFLHATLLERLRFAPVGWTKRYEFSDADFRAGADIIDAWVDSVSPNTNIQNIEPSKIPWAALQAIIVQVVYGGRIDNEFDKKLLATFVNHLFSEQSYNHDFKLNAGVNLFAPDGAKALDFSQWIEKLDPVGTPAWLGLPGNAERMLRMKDGI